MASYRDKHDMAEKANKEFQLKSGVDHSFAESEEFKASYIEGLNMAEQAAKLNRISDYIGTRHGISARM